MPAFCPVSLSVYVPVEGCGNYQQPPYVPTPEEIREACAEIQSTWSPQEYRLRALGHGLTEYETAAYTIPEVRSMKGGRR